MLSARQHSHNHSHNSHSHHSYTMVTPQHSQQHQRKHRRNRHYHGTGNDGKHSNNSLEVSYQREATRQLEKTLRELDVFEDDNDTRRVVALDILEDLLCRWALTVGRENNQIKCSAGTGTGTETETEAGNQKSNSGTGPSEDTDAVGDADASGTASSSSPDDDGSCDDVPRVALISFGSYRLGVHGPSSDLDLLALAPPSCTRGDFFTSLVQILRSDERISEVHPIPTAYTPVIKFVLNTVQIDLVFGRVNDATKLTQYHQKRPLTLSPSHSRSRSNDSYDDVIQSSSSSCSTGSCTSSNNSEQETPGNTALENTSAVTQATRGTPVVHQRMEYTLDDSDLIGLDEASVRSLNGVRVSQKILDVVPNKRHFRLTLRAIKAWATVHGIHSNVLGFLGGVNWAILVAWVCIRHPHAYPPKLLKFFFRAYATWKWPTPVTLGPILTQPPSGVKHLPAWNPEVNPRDGLHFMPIITPAYPSMNSSYNVGLPQMRRMQDEMIRASYILENDFNRVGGKNNVWKRLFSECDFFKRHHNFLQINIRATNGDDFLEWFRLCESRLRLLITSLETPDVVNVWPYGKFFDRRYSKNGVCEGSGVSEKDCIHESCFFLALRFAPHVETVDLRYSTSDFLHMVNSWDGRKPGMDLSIARITAKELPSFVLNNPVNNNNINTRRQPLNEQKKEQHNQENDYRSNKSNNRNNNNNKNKNTNNSNKNKNNNCKQSSNNKQNKKTNSAGEPLMVSPAAIQKMTIGLQPSYKPKDLPEVGSVASPSKRARKVNAVS